MFGCGQQNGVSGVVGNSPLVSCGAIPLADIELRYDANIQSFKHLFLFLHQKQSLSLAVTSKYLVTFEFDIWQRVPRRTRYLYF
jgi:hypothetical protein